jgi:Sulfotransferase domain
MPQNVNERFLFIHVMKTGGTSFFDVIADNFSAEERYPEACVSPNAPIFRHIEAYLFVPGIVSEVNALQGKLRIVSGHIPYATRALLKDPFIAITLLRNPVDRTLSYLKHCRRYHLEHQGMDLEEIYEDLWFRTTFIQNYQTKLFSMSPEEALAEDRFLAGSPQLPPRHEMGDGTNLTQEVQDFRSKSPGRVSLECFAASTGVIQVNSKRLSIAKENLASVEVVGVTERYDRFLRLLNSRYGWQVKSMPHRHTGERDIISPQFKNRIALDNEFDMELYEHAMSVSS